MSSTQSARLVLAPNVAYNLTPIADQEPTVKHYLDQLKGMDGVQLGLVTEAELKSPLVDGRQTAHDEPLRDAGTQIEIQFERRAKNG